MAVKLVKEDLFRMSEEEVRYYCTYGTVGIHYGFNNYHHDVDTVIALSEEVRKDFPNMSNKDMDVWTLSRNDSIMHAGMTTLFVQIPIEDYLRLRNEDAFEIR